MSQTYTNFSTVEQGGQRYIIGQPADERGEPVRFSGKLEETEGIDATFRDVIKSLIQQDLSGALNLEANAGGAIARDEAIKTLLNAEESPVSVQSEQQAEAMIDYFIDNEVLKEDGSDIVVLSDPESLANIATEGNPADEETTMLLNWMSAIEGCTTKIQETINTVEQVEDELRQQMGEIDVAQKLENYEQKQKEVAQRLMNLTNGGELDRNDLTAEEQAEYDRLEHRMFHLKSMVESIDTGGQLDQEIEKMTKELGMEIEKLRDTQTSLKVQLERLEKVYKVNKHIDYEEAKQMAEHLSTIASGVAGVDSAEEMSEEHDTMEVASSLLNELDDSMADSQTESTSRPTEHEQV